MKKVCVLLLILCAPLSIGAQVPHKISFQAVVRDAEGNLIPNTGMAILLEIRAGSSTGPLVYGETNMATTDANGRVSLSIGSGAVISGDLEALKWHTGTYFLKAGIDPSGGDSWILMDTLPFVTVPYAFYAHTAGKVQIPVNESQGMDNVLIISDSAGLKIKNVHFPTDGQDAVTMEYIQKLFDDYLMYSGTANNTVTDYEGNRYKAIIIGEQIWMTENLRSTKLNNGTDIPLVSNAAGWDGMTTPAYCWYNNEAANSYIASTCGALYNWHTINTDDLCPVGYRIPNDDDWSELFEELGGTGIAGGKLKNNGTKFWLVPNYMGTNESGFNGLPAGFRSTLFEGVGATALWWSASEASVANAISVGLVNGSAEVTWLAVSKKMGLSVRCISNMQIIIL